MGKSSIDQGYYEDEGEFTEAWDEQQLATRAQLRQRMLHFLHNFLYYMMFEVRV